MEQLRHGEDEIEYLRNKEEQHCLAEVAEYRNNGKCHSRKVAERVTHKHLGGVPTGKKITVQT